MKWASINGTRDTELGLCGNESIVEATSEFKKQSGNLQFLGNKVTEIRGSSSPSSSSSSSSVWARELGMSSRGGLQPLRATVPFQLHNNNNTTSTTKNPAPRWREAKPGMQEAF